MPRHCGWKKNFQMLYLHFFFCCHFQTFCTDLMWEGTRLQCCAKMTGSTTENPERTPLLVWSGNVGAKPSFFFFFFNWGALLNTTFIWLVMKITCTTDKLAFKTLNSTDNSQQRLILNTLPDIYSISYRNSSFFFFLHIKKNKIAWTSHILFIWSFKSIL